MMKSCDFECLPNGRVLVFAVSDLFTVNESKKQILAYEDMYDHFIDIGITDIYCISVNSESLQQTVALWYNIHKIKFISDWNGYITNGIDMLVDKRDEKLGMYSKRYAAIVKDGFVERWFKDDEQMYEKSSPMNVFLHYEDYANLLNHWGIPNI